MTKDIVSELAAIEDAVKAEIAKLFAVLVDSAATSGAGSTDRFAAGLDNVRWARDRARVIIRGDDHGTLPE